ncbi:phosphodiester glycosidase family protein [Pseudomonas aeruginosa]|uniref:phosphodiester glycosidase family protein n=1 Tax=Pseudomonas aeruginosa TaxID=287 RepID=UPI0015588B71|nr:phosphodiester glycosidase family protein [Pseudomonas aeruginosa]NPW38105.1 hypothetical protein [Pseudomonas aeruginosa]
MRKLFIHNKGSLDLVPVIRTKEELFSTTVQNYNKSRKVTAIINTNFYDVTKAGLLDALSGDDPVPADATTPLGKVIYNGKHAIGVSEPLNFYIAYFKDRFPNEGGIYSAFSSGQGDPPSSCTCGIGGLGPLIINGLSYGKTNKYSSGAPKDAPSIGEPPPAAKKFLVQRSSAKFTAFAVNDAKYQSRIGKTCLGVGKDNICIFVQQHGDSGMSLDEVRDEFLSYGCQHAVFFDGSDSSLLFTDVDGFVVTQDHNKDETCVAGLAFHWVASSKKEPPK